MDKTISAPANSNSDWIKCLQNTTSISDSVYIAQHPELRAIVHILVGEIMDKRPKNIFEFSAALFNSYNCPLLVEMINKQLQRMKEQRNTENCPPDDSADIFSETTSTHSRHSKDSTTAEIDRILRFAAILRDRE